MRRSTLRRPCALPCFIKQCNEDIHQRFAEMLTEFSDAEALEIANVFWGYVGGKNNDTPGCSSRDIKNYLAIPPAR